MQSYIRPARSRRIGAEKIADVEFADDLALFSDRGQNYSWTGLRKQY
jgi:hypothetical protein